MRQGEHQDFELANSPLRIQLEDDQYEKLLNRGFWQERFQCRSPQGTFPIYFDETKNLVP